MIRSTASDVNNLIPLEGERNCLYC